MDGDLERGFAAGAAEPGAGGPSSEVDGGLECVLAGVAEVWGLRILPLGVEGPLDIARVVRRPGVSWLAIFDMSVGKEGSAQEHLELRTVSP